INAFTRANNGLDRHDSSARRAVGSAWFVVIGDAPLVPGRPRPLCHWSSMRVFAAFLSDSLISNFAGRTTILVVSPVWTSTAVIRTSPDRSYENSISTAAPAGAGFIGCRKLVTCSLSLQNAASP